MISRRGFFGMLAGLVAAPWLPKQSGVSYRYQFTSGPAPVDFSRRPRRFHKEYLVDDDVYSPIRTFQCGTGELGMLYWSKQ